MKERILSILALVIIILGGYWRWRRCVSPTHVAPVDFISYQASNIALSNEGKFIKSKEVPSDKLETLKKYDFVLVWGMGLEMSDEQCNQLITAANRVPFHSFVVTNPDNDISSLSETELKKVAAYLESGNKNNYQNLTRCIRKCVDKKWFAPEPGTPIELKENVFFHLGDERSFSDLKSYETYMREHHYCGERAPRVAIVAGLREPFAGNKEHLNGMINTLRNKGPDAYPLTAQSKRIEFLEAISPDTIIYFPHGQMTTGQPESFTNWAKTHNVSLFTGLSVLTMREDWEKGPMDMSGGFMGQATVMPELDRALYPYMIIAQEQNKDGYCFLNATKNHAEKFAKIMHNFTTLKHKANAGKKVVIVYFKGIELAPVAA